MLSYRYIDVLTHALLKYVKVDRWVDGWVGMLSYRYIRELSHALLIYHVR